MLKTLSTILSILFMLSLITNCGTTTPVRPESPAGESTGTLQFVANGEDFVRQGITSKDGWDISFDNVWVNLSDITAHQTNPPYEPEMEANIQAEQVVRLAGTFVVDLAAGDEKAAPVFVGEVSTPAGRYNALSWQMVPGTAAAMEGYSIRLTGSAKKDGVSLLFTIGVEEDYSNLCGEYIGDARKGILAAGGEADLEMTFHFDHIFGDGELPPDDSLNELAPGFEPFALVAENDVIETDLTALQGALDENTYQMLLDALPTLGHTGEGHCFYGK